MKLPCRGWPRRFPIGNRLDLAEIARADSRSLVGKVGPQHSIPDRQRCGRLALCNAEIRAREPQRKGKTQGEGEAGTHQGTFIWRDRQYLEGSTGS